jgi:biopolymer transport protein ExbB/TolQ
MSISELYTFIGNLTYGAQAVVAFWGTFCVIVVWRRVGQKRFKTEEAQNAFLSEVTQSLAKGDFEGAAARCDGDVRAVPQLALVAILNRQLGFAKVQQLLQDRFQRDIMNDLEQHMTWVHTVIKTAPMLGLFGTVLGMMGAFGKLATAERVNPTDLASDISLALITTAIGLTTAIPMMVCVAGINIRIRRMEELVAAGLNQFLEVFQVAVSSAAKRK